MAKQTAKAKTQSTAGSKNTAGVMFFGAVFDLSWRMAVVVLVPIIVGNKLDNSLDTKPILTILGLVIAVAGTVVVIRSAVKKADQAIADSRKEDK